MVVYFDPRILINYFYISALNMASVGKVVTIDFLNKRSVVLIRDETFHQLAAKVSGNSNQTLKIECADNGHQ